MEKVIVTKEKIGKIDGAIFSSMIEQMGRAVYGGIYDPGHPCSDENGFRSDVIRLVKEMNVGCVRYPGGNFVSNYRWKDGVGSNRTPVFDIVWRQYEPNIFGTDEFMQWAQAAGVEPVMTVNLGSGTAQEAAELVEYCNCETGQWAERRKRNGHEKPYGIKYWCLGNEMDGEWQVSFKNACDYAEIALEAATRMKEKDSTIQLILCGSSSFDMPSCPEWDETVLRKCFEYVDFLSMHKYYCYDKTAEHLPDFMASADNLRKGIEKICGVIEKIKKEKNSDKRIYISLDEWNIWYNDNTPWKEQWTIGPKRVENVYSSIDATVFASLFGTIINHCDVIRLACLAQLVNVIAPIMVNKNEVLKQTIFYPFKAVSENFKGTVYECECGCKTLSSERFGEYPAITSAFAYDEKDKKGALLICNLSGENAEIEPEFNGAHNLKPYETIKMNCMPDVYNTYENKFAAVSVTEKTCKKTIEMPPYSWAVVIFK